MKMNKNAELKEAHKAMCERVNAATRAYYEGKPIMSDAQFDRLYKDLERFEAVFPMMRAMHFSPIDKIYHVREIAEVRGLKSLKSTDNFDDVLDWVRNMRIRFGEETEFTFDKKYDGFNIAVYLKDSEIYAAFSRSGFSIEPKMIKGVHWYNFFEDFPKMFPFTGRIIGECFVRRSDMEELNMIRYGNDEDPFTDSPHAAFSVIMSKDESLLEYLSFAFWELETEDGKKVDCEECATFKTEQELIEWLELFEFDWNTEELPTDGFVIKLKDHEHRAELGSTAKYPNWALAYKWKSPKVETTVIESRAVKNGYVVSFEPVEINNKKLQRSYTCNEYEKGKKIKVALKSGCVPTIVLE